MRILRIAVLALFAAMAAAVVGLVLLIAGVFGRRSRVVRSGPARPTAPRRRPAMDQDVIDVAAHEVTETSSPPEVEAHR